MIIDALFKTGLRVAHRGARIGVEAAQAGLDLAKAVIDMLDPDPGAGGGRDARVGKVVESVEALAGIIGADRPLGQALLPGGIVDRLFSPGSTLDQFATQDGLKRAIREAIDIDQLEHTILELRQVAEHINAAATPLGRVAARVPKFLRKPLPHELEPREQAGSRAPAVEEAVSPIAQLRDDGHALVNPRLPLNGNRTNGNGLLNGSR
ncbi:MAG: hypothetical protein ACRC20_12625 [Segniliparus sp.]|uniref:hypothetical protein n=1 Tax=Segniliparus sp. TaxID=2804064 RepID=UPI003F2D0774